MPEARQRSSFVAAPGRVGVTFTLLLVLSAGAVQGDPPAGHYDSVDSRTETALRTTLHGVIDDHIRFPLTSGNTDTWDILESADEDPENRGARRN